MPAANAIVDMPGYNGSQSTVTTIAAEHRYHDTIQVSMDTAGHRTTGMLSDEENISACPKRCGLIMARPHSTRKLWLRLQPGDDLKLRG